MATDTSSGIAYHNLTIASGETASDSVNLNARVDSLAGTRLFAIVTPAELTGTSFGVQASYDGGTTYNTMYDSAGDAIAIAAAASRFIQLDPAVFAAVQNLKLVSNGAEAAARTITLVLRSV